MTWIEACPPRIGHLSALPSTWDKVMVHQASNCCCSNVRLAQSASTGSAGWHAIKLQSPHQYQQTSLSNLMGL